MRFTRAEWLRALRGVPEADGLRRVGPGLHFMSTLMVALGIYFFCRTEATSVAIAIYALAAGLQLLAVIEVGGPWFTGTLMVTTAAQSAEHCAQCTHQHAGKSDALHVQGAGTGRIPPLSALRPADLSPYR